MRRIVYVLSLVILVCIGAVHAQFRQQKQDPVSWTTSVKETGDSIELIAKAVIAPPYHLYSCFLPEKGPNPTTFTFKKMEAYELQGEVIELGTIHEEFDDVFKLNLKMYSDSVRFVHRIKRTTEAPFTITCNVEYQSCKDGECLYGESDLEFKISGKGEVVVETTPNQVTTTATTNVAASATPATNDESLLVFFILCFVAGLLGLLTPCVFPMIPMTVTFFLGKKNKRNALLNAIFFGLSIITIYTLLGLLVSLTSMGADFITDLTTHWITNTIFFLLFAVFAAAFFGLFELRLPSSISSKTDSQVDKGGFLGTFFFALTTVIVSLSCVGPIVGTLLVEAASGAAVKPVLGMFAFSLGFSLPFTLFAIFPSWLNKLPKSGGWMNSVKIVLGFVVLAFSLKFLQGIDVALGLGWLSRPIFLSIWIVLAFFLGLYLLGYLRFKMDSPLQYVGFWRMLMAIGVFAFGIYLIPGLFGAPLYSLSGFMPAQSSEDFNLSAPVAQVLNSESAPTVSLCEAPKYADIIEMPAGLVGYRDYKQALACAKEKGMPVFIEFTGHSCANCKEMAARVISRPEIRDYIQTNFIPVALYVDDKFELPENEWYVSENDGKEKKTIGKQNLDLQLTKFGVNGQPYFFVVSPDGEVLSGPIARELDIQKFKTFLEEGLKKMKK